MNHPKWQIWCGLSVAVTAVLVTTTSPPVGAEPVPVPSPGGGLLPTVNPPLPTPPPLPSLRPPTPKPPVVRPPRVSPPPVVRPRPNPPVGSPEQPGGTTAPRLRPPAATNPGANPNAAGPAVPTPEAAAAIIATNPAADLFPQPPVDAATTPQARLVARLNEVQHRVQYLQNVLARTRSDLAIAMRERDPAPPMATLLAAAAQAPSPATPVDTPEGRTQALASAIASGQAELTRRRTEVQTLQRQINSRIQQAIRVAPPAPAVEADPGGGKLRWPVPGPISSPFGNRFDPYYHVWQLHAGIDIPAAIGTRILAAAGGRVTRAGWYGGYGRYVCIDHGRADGQRLSTCYGHQSRILVSPGQRVAPRQVIGLVGSTGASTGPHVHFEVRLGGRPVDPMPWL